MDKTRELIAQIRARHRQYGPAAIELQAADALERVLALADEWERRDYVSGRELRAALSGEQEGGAQ